MRALAWQCAIMQSTNASFAIGTTNSITLSGMDKINLPSLCGYYLYRGGGATGPDFRSNNQLDTRTITLPPKTYNFAGPTVPMNHGTCGIS